MKYSLTFLIVTVILMALCCPDLTAQLPESYQGGDSDGFAMGEKIAIHTFFKGGEEDGHALAELESSGSIYKGLYADGFDYGVRNASNTFYVGGEADGAAYTLFRYFHLWTGDIGTGWDIAGNWTDNIIPTVHARVRIPADCPHYPAINGNVGNGTMFIGFTDGTPTYVCKALAIDSGAEFTQRISAFVRNYNRIVIEGTYINRNTADLSFINQPGSVFEVRSGGEVLMPD